MKVSKAVYRKQLKNKDDLLAQASLTSSLFTKNLNLLEIEDTENWKPDYDQIFHILRQNYENPRAVNCFIFYDIKSNKVRPKLAKYLLEKGCQRIQKSVYLANIDKRLYEDIFTTFQELEEVLEEEDSIFMVPIGEYHLAELKMIGKDVDMSFSRSSQYVLYF